MTHQRTPAYSYTPTRCVWPRTGLTTPKCSYLRDCSPFYAGGANGAEAAFGETAERWGLGEINFSFAGHETTRRRGVVELSDAELERGGVRETYFLAQLHRSFPSTKRFQYLLKSIWHQVSTAGEVFVVGEILGDDTVKGGTGWGAELAKHLGKPVFVFDQTKNDWFRWDSSG